MKWNDATRYRQGDNERVPRSWTCDIGRVDVTIHRHIDYPPDVWLLRCNFLDGMSRKLESKDVEDAKVEAIAMVREALVKKVQEYQQQLDLFPA